MTLKKNIKAELKNLLNENVNFLVKKTLEKNLDSIVDFLIKIYKEVGLGEEKLYYSIKYINIANKLPRKQFEELYPPSLLIYVPEDKEKLIENIINNLTEELKKSSNNYLIRKLFRLNNDIRKIEAIKYLIDFNTSKESVEENLLEIKTILRNLENTKYKEVAKELKEIVENLRNV